MLWYLLYLVSATKPDLRNAPTCVAPGTGSNDYTPVYPGPGAYVGDVKYTCNVSPDTYTHLRLVHSHDLSLEWKELYLQNMAQLGLLPRRQRPMF